MRGDLGFTAAEEPNHKKAADGLGDHGGQSSPPHAQSQQEDEHRVQQHIQNRTDDYRGHAHGGIALTDDILVQSHRQDGEQGAQYINGHVFIGIAIGSAAGAESHEHGLFQQKSGTGEQKGQNTEHEKGIG